MAKSMKIKFGPTKNKMNKPNDESSITKNNTKKRKTKKNKNRSFVESAENTKKSKNIVSPIENEETEESSGSQRQSMKRKREYDDENDKEELLSVLKTKKSKLKNTNCKKEHVKLEEKIDLKSDEKFRKKSIKKLEKSDNSLINDSSKDVKDGRDSRTIFVGNVPVHFNKKILKKLLNEKGEVERMWTRGFIPVSDKITKKTAAIAKLLPQEHPPVIVYALYKTAEGAANALTLNGAIFEDHRLRVTYSDQKHYPINKGVFVGNLPLDVTDDEVFDMFSKCGEIVATRVVRNNNGKGRGIAYVNFSSPDAVELALKLNEETLRSREIRVLRLKTERQMKKIQKSKVQRGKKTAPKNNQKKKGEFSSNKSSDKFQSKKMNSVEFKKKILAKKLTSTTKRKEKKSE